MFQLSNTAHTEPHSCSHGSVGKSRPMRARMSDLKRCTNSFRSSTSSSVSSWTPFFSLTMSMMTSNGSWSSLDTGFSPITTSPYICTKRRYESQAKRSLLDLRAKPTTASSFRPRFKMVSIMPGMEARAPERTDSSSGSSALPNCLPISVSKNFTPSSTSPWIMVRTASRPCSVNAVQASVLMVKPEGTVMPSLHISARLAPLPPSRFFMAAAPSVRVLPKR